jgi:biopolymer transport protein ExbD
MSYLKKYGSAEVSTSSMADIAFLLLTFFLMTTVINNEKGLLLLLPPPILDKTILDVNQRNLFSIQINSQDQYLIEGVRQTELLNMKDDIKKFVLNYGRDKNLSDNPKDAIVSLKTDRGTSYHTYIATLDQIQQAYFEIYAERAGVSPAKFRSLEQNIPAEKILYDKARAGIPMNISIAEPSRIVN